MIQDQSEIELKDRRIRLLNKSLWFLLIVYPWIFNPWGSAPIKAIAELFIQDASIPSGYYFRIPKASVLVLCTVIIVLLLLQIKNVKWRKKYDVPLMIFFGIGAISTLLAGDTVNALIGMNGRFEGFVTFIIYFILYIAAREYLIVTERRLKLLSISIALQALYGLMQYYYLDPLIDNYSLKFQGQAFGTIGNRNFFALLMCLYVPFGVAQFIKKSNAWNYIYCILPIAALIACVTRGAWIGMSFALIIGLILGWKFIKSHLRLGLILGSIGLCIILLNLEGSRVSNRISQMQLLDHQEDRYDAGSGRMKIWQITISVIKDHPIIGVGPENLKPKLLNEYTDLHNEWLRVKGSNIDRAHNDYLHIAVSFGIPGLLIFCWFLFQHYWHLFKSRSNEIAFIVLICLLAFHAAIFFNISIISVTPLMWILLGYGAQISEKHKVLLPDKTQ